MFKKLESRDDLKNLHEGTWLYRYPRLMDETSDPGRFNKTESWTMVLNKISPLQESVLDKRFQLHAEISALKSEDDDVIQVFDSPIIKTGRDLLKDAAWWIEIKE